jgi:hypothetical protein
MLFSNPEWLAEKTFISSNEVKLFKSNATIKGLKECLMKTCADPDEASLPSTSSNSRKRNLAKSVESDEEDTTLARPAS